MVIISILTFIFNLYLFSIYVLASARGHKDIVQLLIDNNANVNEKNQDDSTALMEGKRTINE